jgi:hypothetical protein
MKITKIKEKPLLQSAFEVLLREFGPEKTAKLWRLFIGKKIDYLKIRKKVFNNKSLNKIFQEAQKFNI